MVSESTGTQRNISSFLGFSTFTALLSAKLVSEAIAENLAPTMLIGAWNRIPLTLLTRLMHLSNSIKVQYATKELIKTLCWFSVLTLEACRSPQSTVGVRGTELEKTLLRSYFKSNKRHNCGWNKVFFLLQCISSKTHCWWDSYSCLPQEVVHIWKFNRDQIKVSPARATTIQAD